MALKLTIFKLYVQHKIPGYISAYNITPDPDVPLSPCSVKSLTSSGTPPSQKVEDPLLPEAFFISSFYFLHNLSLSLSLCLTHRHTNTNGIVRAMGKGVFECFFFLLLIHSIYRKIRNYS